MAEILLSASARAGLDRIRGARNNVLLLGDRGLGKRLMADMLAAAYLGCREGELPGHPDFLLIERAEEKGVPVKAVKREQVEELMPVLMTRPGIAEKRVLVIDDASTFSPAGQSVLLKTLEDCQDWLAVILVAHTPMLRTVESRCTVLHIAPPSEKELRAYLGSSASEIELRAAAGRFGTYKYLAARSFAEKVEEVDKALREESSREVVKAFRFNERPGLYEKLGSERELEGFFCWLQALFFDCLIAMEGTGRQLQQAGPARIYSKASALEILKELRRQLKKLSSGRYDRHDFLQLVTVMRGGETK